VVISDAILILAPVKLLWRVKLSKPVKVRLITVFASTVATTVASLVYIYDLLNRPGITEEYTAAVHVRVSAPLSYCTSLLNLSYRMASAL
jgi:hypothetical protein